MRFWMAWITIVLLALADVSNGFVLPPFLPGQRQSSFSNPLLLPSKRYRLTLHYQQGTDGGTDQAHENSAIIAKAVEESASASASKKERTKDDCVLSNKQESTSTEAPFEKTNDHLQTHQKSKDKSLVLPRATTALHTTLFDSLDQKEVNHSSSLISTRNDNKIQQFWKRLRKWGKRPGVKFRLRLGFATTIAFAASSLWAPQRRLWTVAQRWIAHRGFQGIAALGRSVAYLWAVLVAYPRMLDKRALERRRSRKEKELDRGRNQLAMLANEVSRLRQELASIDAEIRSFRREVIAMKAYAKNSGDSKTQDTDVQEAIENEMAQLRQLRADTHLQLTAARDSYSSVRSQSPPEVWEDNLVLP